MKIPVKLGRSSDNDTVVAVEEFFDGSTGGGTIGVRLEIELRILAVVEPEHGIDDPEHGNDDDDREHEAENTESHEVIELWVSEPGLAVDSGSVRGDMMMSA